GIGRRHPVCSDVIPKFGRAELPRNNGCSTLDRRAEENSPFASDVKQREASSVVDIILIDIYRRGTSICILKGMSVSHHHTFRSAARARGVHDCFEIDWPNIL